MDDRADYAKVERILIEELLKSGLVYLASPYSSNTGDEDTDDEIRALRFREACEAAGALMRKLIHVFSPIVHGHPIANVAHLPTDATYWEEYNYRILSMCGAMVVLAVDGWEESRGVQKEICFAIKRNIPIYYISIEVDGCYKIARVCE